ncbi:hypothetical protein D3C71_1913940 [compost metagenome]
MRLPVRTAAVETTQFLEFVLDQKRHHVGQLYGSFFRVGKPRDLPALHQRLAIGGLGVAQYAGRVAHGRNRLARRQHGFDQGNGLVVFRQIP